MRLVFLCVFILLFGCESKIDSKDSNEDISTQNWAFDKRYVKTIQDSSWEQVRVFPLNDYRDFKIDFTLTSTGKPQNCTLYSKGIFINNAIHKQKDVKNKKKILFRPNLIPNTTIIFTQNLSNKNIINVEISDINEFIKTCGDAHKNAIGEYSISD